MKKQILLVEDEQDLLTILDSVFTDEGFEVIQAECAEDAVIYCLQHKPDLVITDLKLGMMDGFTMIEQIHSFPELRRMPFIVVSGAGSPSWIANAHSLGASAFFAKPFDLDELVEAVKRIVTPQREPVAAGA